MTNRLTWVPNLNPWKPKQNAWSKNGTCLCISRIYTPPKSIIKFPDIVKLNTCELFYDQIVDKKSSNFILLFVSEQHNYATRSTSLQHLNPTSIRININSIPSNYWLLLLEWHFSTYSWETNKKVIQKSTVHVSSYSLLVNVQQTL